MSFLLRALGERFGCVEEQALDGTVAGFEPPPLRIAESLLGEME